MAPPPRGTDAYDNYKTKQNKRRKKLRAIAALQKRRKDAIPFVNAAVRKVTAAFQQQLDDQVKRKNSYMRKAQYQKAKAKRSEDFATEAQAHAESTAAELAAVKQELEDARAEVQRLRSEARRADDWDMWWEHLRRRHGEKSQKEVKWMGRPPKSAPDRCWGGGN